MSLNISAYSWTEPAAETLAARLERGQVPQALLIHGLHGLGRRALARQFAAALLQGEARSAVPRRDDDTGPLVHPDFLEVTLEEDKKIIGVQQIRELIAFASLTSHRGGRRVALIQPADALNPAAANSLLKTLEEPPSAMTILLVCETPSRLPATVLSRCERLRIVPPPAGEALEWLSSRAPSREHHAQALEFAGGAPLAALELLEADFGRVDANFAAEIQSLVDRQTTPGPVARRWAKLDDPALCLRWLYWQTSAVIRTGLEPGTGGRTSALSAALLKNQRRPLNMAACFEYVDRLTQALRLQDRALNMELQFAELLMWWYGATGPTR